MLSIKGAICAIFIAVFLMLMLRADRPSTFCTTAAAPSRSVNGSACRAHAFSGGLRMRVGQAARSRLRSTCGRCRRCAAAPPASRPARRRPFSSTRMRSKLRTVDRRWAMAMTVRPRIRRPSASRISSSESPSSAEVASSSSSSGASFRKARAMRDRAAAARPTAARRDRRRSCPGPAAARR